MIAILATVRPSSWNPLLFIHILGATLLVGVMIVAVYAVVNARRRGDRASIRFAYRALWMGVLPSYIVMRVGAGLIADKEKLTDSNAAWIGIGFTVADGGLFVLLIMLIIMGLAARRSKAEQPASQGALTAVTVLGGIVLAAYVVAIYAMTAKPQ